MHWGHVSVEWTHMFVVGGLPGTVVFGRSIDFPYTPRLIAVGSDVILKPTSVTFDAVGDQPWLAPAQGDVALAIGP